MKNLAHIGIEVSDIYTMELFYRKVLGFLPLYRYVSINTPGLRTVLLKKNTLVLELLSRPGNPAVKKGPFHLSLGSNNIYADFKRCQDWKVENLKPVRQTGDGFLEFSFTDPEGNLIEISRRNQKPPFYPIRAVIFDLDGTLIDSEENYYEADRRLMKEYGIEFTPEMKKEYVGYGNREMLMRMKKIYDLPAPVETLLQKKNAYYLEIARSNTAVYPEMVKLLNLLKKAGYPLALASGSSPVVLKEILAATGLNTYFSVWLSAEDVKQGKPAPDIFLESARRLNFPPENCLVVEDAQYGVEAAKRAFMTCMAIPSLAEKPLPDSFLLADLLFENGMKTFKARKAFRWIQRYSRKRKA